VSSQPNPPGRSRNPGNGRPLSVPPWTAPPGHGATQTKSWIWAAKRRPACTLSRSCNRIAPAPTGPAHPGLVLTVLFQTDPAQTITALAIPARAAPVLPDPSAAKEASRALSPPAAANPVQAARAPAANPESLLPTAPMARDRAAARNRIPTPHRAPKERPVPAGSPRLGTVAPANRLQEAAPNPGPPRTGGYPLGGPWGGNPGPPRTGGYPLGGPWGGNPAASPNPPTRANPPAPGGQALRAERSVAKNCDLALGRVADSAYSVTGPQEG